MFRVELRTFWPPIETCKFVNDNGDPIIKALNGLPVYYRHHIKNGLALGKGLKIVRYQDFTKKRNQSQKRKETKRNEGRVNKKRRVEDVEKVDDVEKFVNLFTKRLHIDDV